MRLKLASLAILAAACATDPSTARSVSIKPGRGGVLTLSPHEDPRARSKADAIMAQTCGAKKAEISEEGETFIGTKKSSNTAYNTETDSHGVRVAGLGFPSSTSTSDSEERQLIEWRVTYECK